MGPDPSSLSLESYPIEVAVAVGAPDETTPLVWSTLIQPPPDWLASRTWECASERVHGIALADLGAGLTPRAAMTELNARLPRDSVVLSDGGAYDPLWLGKLARAAKVRPSFQLWDIKLAFVLDRRRLDRCTAALAGDEAEHRAAADCLRLWHAVKAALI